MRWWKIIALLCAMFITTGYTPRPEPQTQPKLSKESIPSNIPSDVREQIERLYSSDPMQRGSAAVKLGEMGKDAIPAIPYLIGILGDYTGSYFSPLSRVDKDASTNLSPDKLAAEALTKIGAPAVEPLIAALKDDNPYIRILAAETLGNIWDVRAIEPLNASLNDENWSVKISAAKALGKFGDINAIEILIGILKSSNNMDDTQLEAAEALGMLGVDRALEPLIDALKDTKPKLGVIMVLGRMKDHRAIGHLISIINNEDEDARTRAIVAEAFASFKDVRTVEPLIAALKDMDRNVQRWAAIALGNIGDDRAIRPLEELAKKKDTNSYVRDAVKEALGKIKARQSDNEGAQ